MDQELPGDPVINPAYTGINTTGLAGVSTAAPETPMPQADFKLPPTQDTGLGSRIALALEGFGAGYRGQEPLALKLRRQQMLEDQQRQEQAIKLMQMQAAKIEHDNTMFFKSAEALKGNPKAYNQLVETDKSPAAGVFRRVGVTTADFDKVASPQYLQKLAVLDPAVHTQLVGALSGKVDPKTIDPNTLRHYAGIIDSQDKATVQAKAEANDFAALDAKSEAGTLTGPEKIRYNKYLADQAKQDAEYEKNRELRAAVKRAKGSGDADAAEAAAGLNTPGAVASRTTAEQEARAPFRNFDLNDIVSQGVFGKLPGQLAGQLEHAELQSIAKQGFDTKRIRVGMDRSAVLGELVTQQGERIASAHGAGTIQAQLDKPLEKDAPLYREKRSGKAFPAGTTHRSALKQDAIVIRPDQVETVNQLSTIDGTLKEVSDIGHRILRRHKGNADFIRAIGQKGLLVAARNTGDPDVALLDSTIARATVPLIKLQGDTANVAVAEREIFGQSMFSDTDTIESLDGKIRSIRKATKQTKSAMGFDVSAEVPQLPPAWGKMRDDQKYNWLTDVKKIDPADAYEIMAKAKARKP